MDLRIDYSSDEEDSLPSLMDREYYDMSSDDGSLYSEDGDYSYKEVECISDDSDEESEIEEVTPPTAIERKEQIEVTSNAQKIKRLERILDCGSTFSLFSAEEYVENKQKTMRELLMKTNGGSKVIDEIADDPVMDMKVHFNADAITNLYALHDAIKKGQVYYNSTIEDTFIVELKKPRVTNKLLKFKATNEG